MHELEAWLLSDARVFPSAVRAGLKKVGRPPEEIDFDEPHEKLLNRLYRDYPKRHYKPCTDGAALFRMLDPAAARERGPRLGALLDAMLEAARDAGLQGTEAAR